MKSFFLICFFGIASAFTLNQIDGIYGTVKIVEFDSDSNIYVATNISDSVNHFYKLNAYKKIVFEDHNFQNIQKIFVRSRQCSPNGTIFVFDLAEEWIKLYEIVESSRNVEKRDEHPIESTMQLVFFNDTKGNIFFNTQSGVAVLKCGENFPQAVINLENVNINADTYLLGASYYQGGQTDREPNAFLAGVLRSPVEELQVVAVIDFSVSVEILFTKPTLQKFYDRSDLISSEITVLAIFGSSLFFGFSGEFATLYVMDLTNREHKTSVIYSQYAYQFFGIFKMQKNILIFGRKTFSGHCHVNIGEVIDSYNKEYKEARYKHQNFRKELCVHSRISTLNEKYFYLTSRNQLYLFNISLNGRVDIERAADVQFSDETNDDRIFSTALDKGKKLWVLRNSYLFLIKQNSTEAEKVTDKKVAERTGILKINKETNEIFVGSDKGLHSGLN